MAAEDPIETLGVVTDGTVPTGVPTVGVVIPGTVTGGVAGGVIGVDGTGGRPETGEAGR